MDKKTQRKYVGSMEQIAYARRVVVDEGKGKGTCLIEVVNGSGLSFTIVVDRGLDIANAFINGANVAFISKTGITSPGLYEEPDLGFLRSFYGGLLTTCGMTYYGAPCYDEKPLGLHGRHTSIPADKISISCEWEKNDYVIRVKGLIRESSVFGENILLKREISTVMGKNEIIVNDTYCNEGFEDSPFMVLYHCNFGYPLLSEDTIVKGNFIETIDRDSNENVPQNLVEHFDKPHNSINEKVYFHKVYNDNGYGSFSVQNLNLNLGVNVSYSNEHLNYLVQWKLMKSGDYVLALEPATNKTTGRGEARSENELMYIKPQEEKSITLKFNLYNNK